MTLATNQRSPLSGPITSGYASVVFTSGSDEAECVAVGIFSGRSRDEDYEAVLGVLERFDRAAANSGKANVHILIVGPEYPATPARWRKRIGDVNQAMISPHYYFALVTQSSLIRGVFTAIQWLIGARAGRHTVAVASFAEAAAWVRKSTGDAYPQLEALEARARAAMRDVEQAMST